MRRLRRPGVGLPTLAPTGLGGRAAQRNLERHQGRRSGSLSFPDHWNKEDVRGVLYAMHGPTCAYCSCALPRNDRGDVEHFRPKNQVRDQPGVSYWWLAYAFDNYLLSCRPCNSARKSNRFPLLGGAHTPYASRAALGDEQPLLVDPAREPVDTWLRVDWRADLCPVRLTPAARVDPQLRDRLQRLLAFFRLNDDALLVRERRDAIDAALRSLERSEFAEAQRQASRYAPFGFAVRQMLQEQTRYDVAPPTLAQELGWLIEDWLGDLRLCRLLLRRRADRRTERLQQELSFSLAATWIDPPTGEPDHVAERLSEPWMVELVSASRAALEAVGTL